MVFDTNVLVYAARDDSEFQTPCQQRLAEARAGAAPAYLTWNICYEFLRVITHHNIYPRPWSLAEARRFLAILLESPSFSFLRPTEKHFATLSEVAAEVPDIRGNLVHDMHTAVLMRENGVSKICTRDADFRRFPFLEVIDPLE